MGRQRNIDGTYRIVPVEERLAYIKVASGCWEWSLSTNNQGYGVIGLHGMKLAHRVAAHVWLGMPLDSGAVVMHKCDNRKCINPDHLVIGSHSLNMRDCVDKGRHPAAAKTHCVRGHEYTPSNTIRRRSHNGRPRRDCKACRNAYRRAWRARKSQFIKEHCL